MKKQVLTILAVISLAGSAFAQGTVTMGNNASSLVRYNDAISGTAVAVGSLTFQLYAGPDAGSLVAQLPTGGTSALAAGRMANVNVILSNIAPGATGTFQIWAWDSAYATYEEALPVSWTGKSVTFTAATGGVGEPPSLPTALAGLYPGFAVSIVPEPSTIALAGLGLAGLLLFRRRK